MDHAHRSSNEEHWPRSSIFTLLDAALLFLALGLCLRELLGGSWSTGLAWVACAAVAAVVLIFRSKLPPFFGLLLISAALVNAAGYVFNLWHDRTLFDEFVHAFTTFAGMGAVGWLFRPSRHRPTSGFFLWLALSGLTAGIVWEVFEWSIGIIGDLRDTLLDLAMDSLGILAAGILIHLLTRSRATLEEVSCGALEPDDGNKERN